MVVPLPESKLSTGGAGYAPRTRALGIEREAGGARLDIASPLQTVVMWSFRRDAPGHAWPCESQRCLERVLPWYGRRQARDFATRGDCTTRTAVVIRRTG